MIVSHTHKFILFSSSKVGTTSMEKVLAPYQEGTEYQFGSEADLFIPKHIPPAMVRGAFSESQWAEYFKVVFVRNPWDWFVSQWFYNTVGATDGQPTPTPVRRGLRARVAARLGSPGAQPEQPPLVASPPTSRTDIPQHSLRAEDVDAVFELLKRFKGLPGRDGLYQSNWVYDMDDRQLVDFIGRYETLEDDFRRVTGHLGIDVELPHLNRTVHDDYRVYYSEEGRQRVAELWAVDVKNFGYTFAPPDVSTAAEA